MKKYILKMQDGTNVSEDFHTNRDALMYSRRYNEINEHSVKITDVLCDGNTILSKPQRSKIDRIEAYVKAQGFILKRKKFAYMIESDNRKLLDIIPHLKKLVKEDLDGYVLQGTECLDFRERKYLYRVLFD